MDGKKTDGWVGGWEEERRKYSWRDEWKDGDWIGGSPPGGAATSTRTPHTVPVL